MQMSRESAPARTAQEMARQWCLMWNDDPSLAHDLVTDVARCWFGNTGADAGTGPADLERFVADYRRPAGIRFTPRLLVEDDGGERFAYLWDATHPDGSAVTGADVNVRRDGRIAKNWTLAGERRAPVLTTDDHDHDDPGAPREELEGLCQAWSPMWNGDAAASIVSDQFRIWFGAQASAADDLQGPQQLAAYVSAHRDRLGPLLFAKHRDLVIDTERQRAAFTWTVDLPTPEGVLALGGIDVFQVTGGRFARTWSLTGRRPFTF